MAERKRRARRQPVAQDHVPVPVPVQEPAPAHPGPRLTRARWQEAPRGYQSGRPGDHWRERLRLRWEARGSCAACGQPTYLLVGFEGEAAVCDLRYELDLLRAAGACTCSYATLEGVS